MDRGLSAREVEGFNGMDAHAGCGRRDDKDVGTVCGVRGDDNPCRSCGAEHGRGVSVDHPAAVDFGCSEEKFVSRPPPPSVETCECRRRSLGDLRQDVVGRRGYAQ